MISQDKLNNISPNFDYTEVRECDYKGEHYSVRDNGAIMRHPNGERKRPYDNKWTFGNKDAKSGYMTAMGVRVHIVVATAFHGANDSTKMVVDHLDTNRCNNRPENLRWLTKLENILLNEYTRSKVEYICGSIENFLANPQLLFGYESEDPNFVWMRTVTKEEAQNTLDNLNRLVRKPRPQVELKDGSKVDEWIYQSWQQKKAESLRKAMSFSVEPVKESVPEVDYDPMLPIQCNPLVWSRFPRVDLYGFPDSPTKEPLQTVYNNLSTDFLFSKGPYADYYVVERAIYNDNLHILLHDKGEAIKPWAYYRVWWDETHYRAEGYMCFEEEGARALYCRAQDIPGYEEETLDDACM